MNRRMRIGYALMFAEILFGGMLPVLGKMSYASLTPMFTAAISMLIAAGFFAVVLTIRRTWRHLLHRDAWPVLLGMTLLIAVGYYGCMFAALSFTSAANVAILSRFEILTTILLLGVVGRHEHVTRRRAAGAALMLAGVVLALFSGATPPNVGDFIILIGTFLTPYGNLFQKRSREMVSGEAVYFFRSFVGGLVLLAIAFAFEAVPGGTQLRTAAPILIGSGVLAFGVGKLLFVEALHRLPITVAIPLGALSIIVTIGIAAITLGESIHGNQILALVPLFTGIVLLTRDRKRTDVVMED